MVTEEDVKKIQSELTDEQIRQLLYLLQKDKLVELKELARKKCKTKFVNVMRRYINKFFKGLGGGAFPRRISHNNGVCG